MQVAVAGDPEGARLGVEVEDIGVLAEVDRKGRVGETTPGQEVRAALHERAELGVLGSLGHHRIGSGADQ